MAPRAARPTVCLRALRASSRGARAPYCKLKYRLEKNATKALRGKEVGEELCPLSCVTSRTGNVLTPLTRAAPKQIASPSCCPCCCPFGRRWPPVGRQLAAQRRANGWPWLARCGRGVSLPLSPVFFCSPYFRADPFNDPGVSRQSQAGERGRAAACQPGGGGSVAVAWRAMWYTVAP